MLLTQTSTIMQRIKNAMTTKKQGFSLIELSIVFALIGLILAGVMATYFTVSSRTKLSATRSLLLNVKTSIDNFQLDTGILPASLTDLLERPSNDKISKKWRGPYLNKEAIDGYSNELMYRPTKGGKHQYELYSWGPNGEGAPEEEWIDAWNL